MNPSRFGVVVDHPSGARRARFATAHGVVETPQFMPVGTHGAVKGLLPEQLGRLGATMILANAYHLGQRPGPAVLAAVGGVHGLMGWPGPILTDSGGFQAMSLGKLVKVTNEGIRFQSHVDGREGFLTPEGAVGLQEGMGVDVAMSLDECVAAGVPRARVEAAMERTHAWAVRGLAARSRHDVALFAIVQGGFDEELRARSAAGLVVLPFDGYALGGVSVGEPAEETARIGRATVAWLPADRPRYVMGVGTPADLLRFVSMGYDLFDCVLPTRNARNGMLFTRDGKVMIRNARHANDPRPVDETCRCYTCQTFSRAALRHFALAGEMLAAQLATIHNVYFFMYLMAEIRGALEEGTYPARAHVAAGAWATA